MKILLATLLFALTATAQTPLETALTALRMSPHDLTFQKDNAESVFVLPTARLALQQPLALPALAENTRRQLGALDNLAGFVPIAGHFLATDIRRELAPPVPTDLTLPADLPPALADAVHRLYAAVNSFQPQLPKPDPAVWEAFALSTFSAKTDRAAYAPGLHQRDDALELQDDEVAHTLLTAGNQLDRPALLGAFAALCRVIDETLPALRVLQTTNRFQHTLATPLGPILLGGVGQNVYTNARPLLIIDLGGDDTYESTATNAATGISVIIDLAGNDRYAARGIGAQGAGIFGIGILVDCAGDDTYSAEHVAQGAGVFGCGLLADFGGQDKFSADTFAQGAGAFGVGILWQRQGDTIYRAAEKSQAFASTLGVGLLLDGAGNDKYVTGGKYPCRWLEGHNFTLAQGMAIGLRPFAGGGVAVLCDQAGNDSYEADVYGQGASYWYSLAMLIDEAGNDTYKAYQYAQGAGIHLSSGLLWDINGDDVYDCHAICQGGAHDYSVGILLEDDGNDRYRADSTAQGSAINNSFALLVDRAGNDTYTGTDPKQSQAAGHDGGRREYGSIAVLLDLSGQDVYSQGWTNNSVWSKPWYGAGLDTERRPGLPALVEGVVSVTTTNALTGPQPRRSPPVDVRHPIERLGRRATRDWETAAEKLDTEAAEAELKTRAAEALPYLITRLASPGVMLRVQAEQLVDHLGTNAIPLLIDGVRSARNEDTARICCYFLARFESATNAIPVLLPLLEREPTRTTALYTLGHLRASAAFGAAATALESDREIVRLRAAQALGRIGHPHAIPKLIPRLDDEYWTVRYAAENALVALGWRSIEALRNELRDASPRARPHLQAALKALKR